MNKQTSFDYVIGILVDAKNFVETRIKLAQSEGFVQSKLFKQESELEQAIAILRDAGKEGK